MFTGPTRYADMSNAACTLQVSQHCANEHVMSKQLEKSDVCCNILVINVLRVDCK